ncbi:MAG: hypothetical protein GY697_26220 [Desulfobacterales bacterium]|nr:hypothetical protein [Desulfobacterales bacterium]
MFTKSEKKNHFRMCVILIMIFEFAITVICFYQSVDEYYVKVVTEDNDIKYFEQCLTRAEHAHAFKRAEATRSGNDTILAGEIPHSFPFISWACFAICIPLGIHLFYSLAILKFESGQESATTDQESPNRQENAREQYDSKIEKILNSFGNMHHNMIGGIVFIFFLGLGMLTTFLSSVGDATLQLLIAYKGYFFAVMIIVCLFALIKMISNHFLKRDAIIQQAEVEKAYALGSRNSVPLLEVGKPLLPRIDKKNENRHN